LGEELESPSAPVRPSSNRKLLARKSSRGDREVPSSDRQKLVIPCALEEGPVRAYVRIDDASLAERVEASLRRLGYPYLKNRGRNVTGFEVQSPCRFIVTVENLTREQLGYPLRSRVRVESAIDFTRTIGARETGSELKQRVSALVQDLCSDLKDERLKGLLALRPMAEKARWEEEPGEP